MRLTGEEKEQLPLMGYKIFAVKLIDYCAAVHIGQLKKVVRFRQRAQAEGLFLIKKGDNVADKNFRSPLDRGKSSAIRYAVSLSFG